MQHQLQGQVVVVEQEKLLQEALVALVVVEQVEDVVQHLVKLEQQERLIQVAAVVVENQVVLVDLVLLLLDTNSNN
jgi:hypothetical protein